MLIQRLITAFVLISLVIAILFWLPPLGFIGVLLFVCLFASWEWARLSGLTSHFQRASFMLLCGIGFAALGTLVSLPSPPYIEKRQVIQLLLWMAMAWWCFALFLVLSYQNASIKKTWWSPSPVRALFGLFTLLPFFLSLLLLRQFSYDLSPKIGAWCLLYVMCLVWVTDSGAYFVGRYFGKHKLLPRVSPGKTWEGLIGGLIIAALFCSVLSKWTYFSDKPLILWGCSIVAVLASVLGDLTESLFKREAGLKDSGKLIPGHGGILDRIDSLTAAFPVFTCLLMIFGLL